MGLSYFFIALLVEAINFMMPLALIAGLLCKRLRVSLLIAVAVGLVGALQTYTELMSGSGWRSSIICIHVIARFIDLALVVLLTGLIKEVITRRALKNAGQGGEKNHIKIQIVLSIVGIIVGVIVYFFLPPVGVGIILGSFFLRMRYAAVAGVIWTVFYITVLYYAVFYARHVNPPSGLDLMLWIPWSSVVIGLLLPPVTTYFKLMVAKKLGGRLAPILDNIFPSDSALD